MLRRLAVLLPGFLPALLTCLAATAQAESVLRVTTLHSEPWAYYVTENNKGDKRSRTAGIIPEVLDTLSRTSGLELKHTLAPYSQVWRDMKSGDCDLAFDALSNKRDDYAQPFGHVFSYTTIIVGRPGIKLNEYEDLRGLRVGVLDALPLSMKFEQDSRINKIPVRDYETMVGMLLTGRLDAIAGNSVSLSYLLHKEKIPLQQWPRLVLEKQELWLYVARRSPYAPDTRKLSESVEKLRREGYFDALLTRHAGNAWRVD